MSVVIGLCQRSLRPMTMVGFNQRFKLNHILLNQTIYAYHYICRCGHIFSESIAMLLIDPHANSEGPLYCTDEDILPDGFKL